MMTIRRALLAAAMMIAVTGLAADVQAQSAGTSEKFAFVLPWDDATPGPTDVSGWLEKPAGKSGFVKVKDGRLFAGDKRIRFLGVNNSFSGNFPTHEEAEKIAARMAKFGINCVRFHHMDTQPAPTGILEKDGITLNKENLDRMDYFVAQLKKNGIYANINLHVGRHYPGEPDAPGGNRYYKGIDQYVPRMIQLQKDYARDLLTHVNPYTKTAYADEPAVAFVEINNENALIHSWWGNDLEDLAPAHQTELTRQWNAWLAGRYKNDGAALEKAWQGGAQIEGVEILDGNFDRWRLEQHQGAQAIRTILRGPENLPPELAGRDAISSVKMTVNKTGSEGWYVQLSHPSFELKAGQSYAAEVWARADKPRDMSLVVGQAHEPWQQFGHRSFKVTEKWKKYRLVFNVPADEDRARFVISGLGKQSGDCQFAGASLRVAKLDGLAENEKIGSIPPFQKNDMPERTLAAQKDWIQFLWDTEEKYWLDMQDYIKKNLKSKSLVIGTQMGYSPFPIQAKMDVVDVHSYWQHPRFPGKPWDQSNWTVGNKSMVTAEGAGGLGRIAGTRVYGKPYICTEYNHAAPNQFDSEAFLLAATFAAQQDWDGIFVYSYSHAIDSGKSGKISSFFDIAQHPTKMATLPAAAAMFVRGDIKPLNFSGIGFAQPKQDQILDAVRTKGPSPGAYQLGIQDRDAGLKQLAGVVLPGFENFPKIMNLQYTFPAVNWDAAQGLITISAAQSAGIVGYADRATYTLNVFPKPVMIERRTPTNWQPGKPPFDKRWCAITATVMDGKDFASAQKIMIVATGGAENTGWTWKNDEKTSVTKDWGKAPSLVEGIDATITLPMKNAKVWALDEKGQRKEEVPVTQDASGGKFEIGPKYKTLWYETAADK